MAATFETRWSGVGIGGSVALDFANTYDWRLRDEPVELLHGYVDLLRWAWSAGVLERGEAEALRDWAEAHPRAARGALERAVALREAIAAVMTALIHDAPPPAAALAQVEAACIAAWSERRLQAEGQDVSWTWRGKSPAPDRPAWAVALDAERILTSPERERVRQCGDAECGWFFLDTSRNSSRRWCSMEACGNRNKARRFYRRSTEA